MMFWRRFIKPSVLAAAFWVLTGSSPAQAEILDRLVAKVNSDIITLSNIQERSVVYVQQRRAAGRKLDKSPEAIMEEILEKIIDEKLQVQEARKLGLEVDEEAVLKALDDIKINNNLDDEQLDAMLKQEGRSRETYKQYIRDQILVTKITNFSMGSPPKASPKKIKKYYRDHIEEFRIHKKPFVRHILFIMQKEMPARDRKIKQDKARKALKEIREGLDFEEAARLYSEDVSASSGGEIGEILRGQMVREFEDEAFRLEEGEVSGLIRTQYGLHIIKVDKITPEGLKSISEVKDAIESRFTREAQKKHYDAWMARLRESAFIEISLFEDSDRKKRKRRVKLEPTQTARLPKNTKRRKSSWISEENREYMEKISREKRAVAVQKKAQVETGGFEKKSVSEAGASELSTLEKKLRYIKKLRNENKISEQEYQRRKKRLLDTL